MLETLAGPGADDDASKLLAAANRECSVAFSSNSFAISSLFAWDVCMNITPPKEIKRISPD
jgi:hypothetical protein